MSFWIRGLAALLIPTLMLCGCGGPPATRQGAQKVRGMDLKFGDDLPSFDLAVSGDTTAYLVWNDIVHFEKDNSVDVRTWFRQRDLRTSRWSDAIRLPRLNEGYDRTIRVVPEGGSIHVFSGTHVLHWVSDDGGRTWAEVGTLVPKDKPAESFSVAPDSSGRLCIVYPEGSTRVSAGDRDSIGIWALQVNGRALKTSVRVAVTKWTPFTHPEPQLLAHRDSLYLFYTTADSIARMRGPYRTIAVLGKLFVARSGDGGSTWSTATEIKGLGAPPDLMFPGEITSIAPVWLNGRAILFYYGGSFLFATESRHDGSWSKPTAVCFHPTGRFAPYSLIKSVSAAGSDRAGQLVWVDTRYARTDHPLLPLMELPQWDNDDVLQIPLSLYCDSLPENPRPRPARITRNLSYADKVCARAGTRKVYVAWSGTEKMGKTPRQFRSPPTLFFMTMPKE